MEYGAGMSSTPSAAEPLADIGTLAVRHHHGHHEHAANQQLEHLVLNALLVLLRARDVEAACHAA